MSKHPECAKVCQYADEVGVWPEHQCSGVCQWLQRSDGDAFIDSKPMNTDLDKIIESQKQEPLPENWSVIAKHWKECAENLQRALEKYKTTASELFDRLDLSIDEFQRIEIALAGDDSARAAEIRGLCNRAVQDIRQRVPVILQRDDLQKKLTHLRVVIEKSIELIDDEKGIDAMAFYLKPAFDAMDKESICSTLEGNWHPMESAPRRNIRAEQSKNS